MTNPEPPQTAVVVTQGTKTERESQLERELADTKRSLQTRVSELEDENSRLKTPTAKPTTTQAQTERGRRMTVGMFTEDEEE